MGFSVGLNERLSGAELSPSIRCRFGKELERLAQIDGRGFDPDEVILIMHVVGAFDEKFSPAPFESLWRHAELFLTSCIHIAVADGRYSVEKARHISSLASRLGWSAAQLSMLEGRVLQVLAERGQLKNSPTL
jgi:hypothetical protein